ncbi:MAG: hypothetical protein HQK69_05055 [Desulfamplus sp.]|nr:hypothetical protein [Desulfamplus sp.]
MIIHLYLPNDSFRLSTRPHTLKATTPAYVLPITVVRLITRFAAQKGAWPISIKYAATPRNVAIAMLGQICTPSSINAATTRPADGQTVMVLNTDWVISASSR